MSTTNNALITIKHRGKKLLWPAHDTELQRVNDYVSDLTVMLSHVDRFDLAVQAGGACGVWPLALSNKFKTVITFEPEKLNYQCLQSNVFGVDNILAYESALSSRIGTGALKLGESHNAGTYYLSEGQAVSVVTLDSFDLPACDFIQLDIEGGEAAALLGALNTLEKFKPVVVLECKRLPHCPGAEIESRALLESLGYVEVGRVHNDVIFKSL
ncbi:MAG: FkbM family methyltransferase [Chloroflexi bacterium]|nr:MAG: FkbM family methyltransferase [Chloroflexota bacterium]